VRPCTVAKPCIVSAKHCIVSAKPCVLIAKTCTLVANVVSPTSCIDTIFSSTSLRCLVPIKISVKLCVAITYVASFG
jgi:hypothetical protein